MTRLRRITVRAVAAAAMAAQASAGLAEAAPAAILVQPRATDAPPPAPTPRPASVARKAMGAAGICELINASALRHGLPRPFFARLIWKESRFDVRAVSPKGAQGVAQFMPATAKARGLENPFDAEQAIPASAALLADLRRGYGSLGLAAAAYNAGETRVDKWLGGSWLPGETHDYVYSITGKPADWFKTRGREADVTPLAKDKSFREACAAMPVIATRAVPRPPWGVVVAGGRSSRAAHIAFERLRRRAPSLVDASRLHVVRKGRRVAAGPLYTARIGAETRSEARRICLRLARAGFNCYLRRN
ncbi:MAG: lytic transglycosylase domain-containing protein [Pseudomonadota bacterium]